MAEDDRADAKDFIRTHICEHMEAAECVSMCVHEHERASLSSCELEHGKDVKQIHRVYRCTGGGLLEEKSLVMNTVYS